MKKICLAMMSLVFAQAAFAQDMFLNNYMTNHSDLFGTARYVGMGGAMGALGADISAIGSNPAAIGLFRRSAASITGGFMSQIDNNTDGEGTVRASLDQLGFVLSLSDGDSDGYLNVAFNYQKKNNMTHTFIADYTESSLLNYVGGVFDCMYDFKYINPIVETSIKAGLYRENEKDPNALRDATAKYQDNLFFRSMRGHTQCYDLNMSTNVNNRVFLGMTLGFEYMRYKSDAMYDEMWDGPNKEELDFSYNNYQEVKGTGFNVKLGAIFRPIEDDPFRIGLTIETPTYYNINYYGDCQFVTPFEQVSGMFQTVNRSLSYRSGGCDLTYNLSTPWRFRVSAGSTFGTSVAFGLEYEFAGYNYTRMAYPEGDEGAGPWCDERKDVEMNRDAKDFLKGVHAFKAGIEFKPVKNVALRMGYNYFGASCSKKGFVDHTNGSYATRVITNSDWLLLGDVNILTLGAGYADQHFYADFAYKYRMQKADFYPYYDYFYEQTPRQIDLDRQQFMLTLGYKF